MRLVQAVRTLDQQIKMSRLLLRSAPRLAVSSTRPAFAVPRAPIGSRWSSTDPTSKEVATREQETADSKALNEVRPEGAAVAAAVVSGFPGAWSIESPAGRIVLMRGPMAEELHLRPVRIYQPTPTTMQSAKSTSHHWQLDWDVLQGSGRWENPLMGWASSSVF